MKSSPPLISNEQLTKAGILPVKKGPIRFAVGPPNGVTSNSWRFWTSKKGDIYIACRDSFKETKVSLHPSGRWRMGFTTEYINKKEDQISPEKDRAWEVWDEPPPVLPKTVIAFHLFFLTSELAVKPEQRKQAEWKNVIFIEEAPKGKMTVITLFITEGKPTLVHENQPSFLLGLLPIGSNRFAQIIAHADPVGNYPDLIERHVDEIRKEMKAKQISYSNEAYTYLFGHREIGSRFIIGARMERPVKKEDKV